jgi:PAS domain S-box-containing protein
VKRPLKRSRRERDALAVVMDTIRDGIVRCSAGGRILYVNEALCRMTGFAEDELVGAEQPLPYWPDDQVDAMRAFIEVVKGTGTESTS